MSTVDWKDSPYHGSTSRPVGRLEFTRTECLACGSSLHGRSVSVQKWGGKVVQVYRCRCGRGRRLQVPERRAA